MRYAKTFASFFSIAVLLFLSILFRYELAETHPGGQSGSFGMVYRLDRWTGEIIGINGLDAERVNLNK